jgi:hypothetical protein
MTYQLEGARSPVFASKGNTYGTSSNPAETAAIVSYGVEVAEVGEEVAIEQADMKPGRINLPKYYNRGNDFTFSTYLNGSGVLGTPPFYNILFRACGMAQTIQAGASVTLSLMDPQNTQEWVDLACFQGRTKYEAPGSRGTWNLNMTSGQFPTVEWSFNGLYLEPTQPTLPGAPTFSNQSSPVLIDSVGTPTFSLGGYSAEVSTFTLSIGNVISGSDHGGSVKQRLITGREITAEITIAATLFADFNVFQKNTSGATDALQIIHGPALRRTTINASTFGYGIATKTGVTGREFYTVPLHITHTAGAVDDLTMVTT